MCVGVCLCVDEPPLYLVNAACRIWSNAWRSSARRGEAATHCRHTPASIAAGARQSGAICGKRATFCTDQRWVVDRRPEIKRDSHHLLKDTKISHFLKLVD